MKHAQALKTMFSEGGWACIDPVSAADGRYSLSEEEELTKTLYIEEEPFYAQPTGIVVVKLRDDSGYRQFARICGSVDRALEIFPVRVLLEGTLHCYSSVSSRDDAFDVAMKMEQPSHEIYCPIPWLLSDFDDFGSESPYDLPTLDAELSEDDVLTLLGE